MIMQKKREHTWKINPVLTEEALEYLTSRLDDADLALLNSNKIKEK